MKQKTGTSDIHIEVVMADLLQVWIITDADAYRQGTALDIGIKSLGFTA